jgi:hypothetical protein
LWRFECLLFYKTFLYFDDGGYAMAQLVEALRYKPEGRFGGVIEVFR